MMKKLFLGLALVLVIMQFFRPVKNESDDVVQDISTKYQVPDSVHTILQKACYDCHSNKTVYPWYAKVQPVAWWLNNHITEGKRHLNFNSFTAMRIAVQKKKLEDCIDEIKEEEMPLGSYTLIHTHARLSEAEKQTIYNWCNHIIDTIQATYPADSLVLQKPKRD